MKASVDDYSLREYIRLSANKSKDPIIVEAYDDFLLKLWTLFELRAGAEDYCADRRYLVKSLNGALPLPWQQIKCVLNAGGPPQLEIVRIAKRNFAEVELLIRNLRKVLNRVREKVNVGRVQQIDAQCLRWLTRQPGRDAIEKAGSRQEILGVVRVENYNTLENRVLKDFLQRCSALSAIYLRHYGLKWNGHETVKIIRRFNNLCQAGLSVEVMSSVSPLRDLPPPNYVLQQDRLYSKIWKSYCRLLRQEDVAEKLWRQVDEVADLYTHFVDGISLHCSPQAKYATSIWFNDIDGNRSIVENPIWDNEKNAVAIIDPDPPRSSCGIVDLTSPWDRRVTLVYPSNHPNAQPYIQNWHRPSKEPGRSVEIRDILSNKKSEQLKDYLRSYYGCIGGKQWVVLTPDHWDSSWIEQVLNARPSSLGRSNVFMLWRSVAAALGQMEQRRFEEKDILPVEDWYCQTCSNGVLIKFVRDEKSMRVLPQRASTRLHGKGATEQRFWLDQDISASRGFETRPGCCVSGKDNGVLLKAGVERFLREKAENKTSYFDELDALWMVVQTRSEEVKFEPLIEHVECWPGGTVYHGEQRKGGTLVSGSSKISLNLLEGEQRDDAKLKQLEQELGEPLQKAEDIYFEASVTPGQGLASILFAAAFIKEPQVLDLTKMKSGDQTKAEIERKMKRHFPPVMPYVEASSSMWANVRNAIAQLIKTQEISAGDRFDWFARARDYYDGVNHVFDPRTMSPVDKLKRENVFGNNPMNRYPVEGREAWFKKLVAWLARWYGQSHSSEILHLLAWTYQSDNKSLDEIRAELHDKYVIMHQPLEEIEVSFCSNNIAAGDKHISDILTESVRRIGRGLCGPKELRLLYNLLQFNPTAVRECESVECVKAFDKLVVAYCSFDFYIPGRYGPRWGGANSTKMAGYYLKCMLFLLHRRRYDDQFLKLPRGWSMSKWRWDWTEDEQEGLYPNGFLGKALPCKHESLRRSLIEYVNGRGSIEGIPTS